MITRSQRSTPQSVTEKARCTSPTSKSPFPTLTADPSSGKCGVGKSTQLFDLGAGPQHVAYLREEACTKGEQRRKAQWLF